MKIDFYVLEAASGQKSLFFACQLLEKAYAEEKKVYVNANSKEEAERLDALLWTFREDSFIPHHLYPEQDDTPPPIQIGWGQTPGSDSKLLLNLAKEIPPFYQQFEQVIEIVFSDTVVQQLARERYKQYREQGFEINTIKLKANEI